MAEGLDIIGDIHGHANELHRLLDDLGYSQRDGVYTHPDRRVVFLGDFIDRGPRQMEVVQICRRMCEHGAALAVMGNHEFNAIGWHRRDEMGEALRKHSLKNRRQHEEFLKQVGEGSREHDETIRWFMSLPVYLEVPGARFVHACWHSPALAVLQPFLVEGNRLTSEGIEAAHQRGSEPYKAIEVILKGPEQHLPGEISFSDKDGHLRRECRIKWWDATARTLRQAALGMEGEEDSLPELMVEPTHIYDDAVPVFFGHYWLKGTPKLTAANAACLDYSVAKGGALVAYRWSGEKTLRSENLVYAEA